MYKKNKSFSKYFRKKRFMFFKDLIDQLNKPLRILDVGGTQDYWDQFGLDNNGDIKIILLNINPVKITNSSSYEYFAGDARDMRQFSDSEFEVVFSNGVIQCVGKYDDQKKMADEIRRVGQRYFIQSPNRNFPFDYRFKIPFFQFLPLKTKIFLSIKFKLSVYKRLSNPKIALEKIQKDQILDKKRFIRLFPDAYIYKEKFFGFTKSFVALYGWSNYP